MTMFDDYIAMLSGRGTSWDVSLIPEQTAGYISATRLWQERSLLFIDTTLEILYEHERLDPEYLLLPRDDLKHLCYLIAWGTNIYISSRDRSPLLEELSHGWLYINQTTGRLIRAARDDTLAPCTLKFLYLPAKEGQRDD